MEHTACQCRRCQVCLIVALSGVVRVVDNLRTSFAIDYSRMSLSEGRILYLQLERAKKTLAKAEGSE